MRPLARLALAAAVLAAGGLAAVRAQESADRARELGACRALMADRDYAGAEERLRAFAARFRSGEEVEEAALLMARARLLAGRPADALETLRLLVEGAPKGPWTDRARWLMADAYAATRDWGGAAAALRARAEFLASDDHQGSIAALYLAVADEAFDGKEVADAFGRRTRVRDWPRALQFYSRARAVRTRPGDEARVSHRIALSALESGDPARAVVEWGRLFAAGVPDALAPEAGYGLGRALAATGDGPGARKRFREVVDRWKDSEFAPLALIATGDTWHPLESGSRAEIDRGLDAWREFRRLFHGHASGPEVAWRIGLALARFGDRPAAVKEWEEFLRVFPKHDSAPDVVHGIAAARLGMEDFDGAVAAWKDLLARWPNHRLWTQARGMLPRVERARAEALARDRKWPAAETSLRRFLEEFPGDGDAPEVQSRLGDVLLEKGDAAGALEAWRLVTAKYPDDGRAPAAWKKVADHLADRVGDLPAAIAEYEGLAARYPGSGEGQEARAVLAALRGKQLEASAALPCTTDRAPRISLRLRNVDRLRFRAYRVDGAEFIRAKGSLAGADQVVTDVVRADAEWAWQPERYEPFRLLDRECEVPVKGPGAWIVRVQDDELTATLLVVSSDLAAIVKRSASQNFVFVQDVRTGEPVAGARVLLGGDAGATTGADGTWAGTVRDSRVLVEKDGHLAFAAGESGPSVTFGYSSKVYLFTDRPLYRPGEEVAVKGFARRVRDGTYRCKAGEPVKISVTDPRGATVLEREAKTDAFGGVDVRLPTARTAPLGTWSIAARYDDRTFAASFDVLEFRKPELEIAVDTPTPTFAPGAEIRATVVVRYSAGGVAAGAPVHWRAGRIGYVFDGSDLASYASWFKDPVREAERNRRTADAGDFAEVASGEATTDAEGKVVITLPTDAADGDRTYLLELSARDSGGTWVREAASWPVTRQQWYAVARAEKKVYRPAEEMTLEVFTVDALRAPVAAKGRAVLALRRVVGGRTVDEEVSTVAVETGVDGRAVVRLKAERPGDYAMLFRAKDPRGADVEAAAPVTVAGEAQDLSKDLKIVCDRETYREGDDAEILVNCPAAPATVLLTFEGERVLEHRVLRVTERSTTLRVPMKPLFSPNIFVRGSLLRDGALLEDGDEVLVFRFLQVAVEPGVEESLPGRPLKVRVRTTDQRGNPVPAGVALSAVDRAVLALRPDRTPDPRPFFYDQRRELGVRTALSLAFLPAGTTRPTDRDVLAEEARRLGRVGFERMQRHLREGREALDRGDLDVAILELGRALDLAPGQYEARVLLVRAKETLRDRVRETAAGDDALGDRLATRSIDGMARDELEKSGPFAEAREGARRQRKGPAPASAAAPSGGAEAGEDSPAFGKSEEGDGDYGFGGGGGGGGHEYKDKKAGRPGRFRGPAGEVPPDSRQPGDPPPGDAGWLVAGVAGVAGGARAGGFLDGLPVPAELRSRFADTALWAPAVTTGTDGSAEVEVTLPDNLTTWVFTARGASEETLVGEGRARVRVRVPLLVRISAPRFLGQKDTTEVSTVVHNETGREVEATVSLRPAGVGSRGAVETKARLTKDEVRAFLWGLADGRPGLARLRAEALTPVASDAQEIPLPVLPHGIPWRRGASGTCRDSSVAALDLPEGTIPGTVRLRLSVSPALDGVILEALRWNGAFPYGCLEQTVNRFLPALAYEAAVQRAGLPDAGLRERLREAVERGLLTLYGLQRDDGSFGWFGSSAGGDPVMTGYAVLAMLRANAQGHAVAERYRSLGVEAARRLAKSASPDDRAWLLFALAHGGAADLEDLNTVFRGREGLSDRGLACLALAMSLTGRGDRAAEAVALLRGRAVVEGDRTHWDDGTATCRRRGLPVDDGAFHRVHDAEATALALSALLAVLPDDPLVDPALRWLLDRRQGPAWRSTRDTGAVVDALAAVVMRRGVERNDFALRVFVNDGAAPVKSFEIRNPADGSRASLEEELAVDGLRAGRNTVRLEKDGPGSFHWGLSLDAYTVSGEEDIPAAGNLLRVERRWVRYAPAREGPAAEAASEDPPVGWTCLDPAVRPGDDALPSLRVAGSGDLYRAVVVVEARAPMSYVLVEDPLPAGCEVVEGREEGTFDRFERRDDRAVFFLAQVPEGRHVLSYVVQAVFPGAYRALPATASGMYEPEVWGRSAEARLTVEREPGAVSRRRDGESPTPDEVLFLARRALREGRWEAARGGFRTLLGGPRLLAPVEVEAWEAVRLCSFNLKDPKGAVEAHEALLERDPRRTPGDVPGLLDLARAYHDLGEAERAASLFRETVDRLWSREREVADAYAALGDAVRSLAFRGEMLRRYPDGSTTDGEELALARALRETRRPADGGPRPAAGQAPAGGAGAGYFLPEAAERLRLLLAHRSEARNADEADTLLVDTLRRMELHDEALAEGERFLRRYPESRWLDDVTWYLADAAFEKGDYDRSLALAESLASGKFPTDGDPRRKERSPFRDAAFHLRGKIAHLRGNLAEAVQWYERARGSVPDAQDAWRFLTEARLEVAEIASFVPGAEPSLPLRRRNLDTLEVRVYPVDFMLLYAVRKDLSSIHRIDLTGLVPAARLEVKRGDAGDHLWHDDAIPLPVTEKGVYLVHFRGKFEAASLVVLSDLRVEVQRAGPRLRAYVTDARTGAPVNEAYVKVAEGGRLTAQGFTDARGVFETPQAGNAASVVVEKDGSYGLVR